MRASEPSTASGPTGSPRPQPDGCAHTPGPWRIERFPDSDHCRIQPETGHAPGFSLADVYGNAANARLIAAAPEMLAEFRDQLRWLDKGSERYNRVVALIAKAEGRDHAR